MKKLLIAMALFTVSIGVQAQSAKVETKAPQAKSSAGSIYKGRALTLGYSMATDIEYELGSTSGKFNSESAATLGLQFMDVRTKEFGYFLGFNFETPREISSVTTEGVKTFLPGEDTARLSFLYVEPGLSYGINDEAYVFSGLTYAFPTSKSIQGLEIKGDFGFQIGGGYKINKKWMAELLYREVAFKIEADSKVVSGGGSLKPGASTLAASSPAIELDDPKLSGFLLRVTYLAD